MDFVSTQGMVAIDEALSTGASTVIPPLEIDKRETTSSTFDQR
jgi:hypothetical protein